MSVPRDAPQVAWRPRWAVIVNTAIMGVAYGVGVVSTLAWMVMFSNRIFPLALWLIGSPALAAGIAGLLLVVSFLRRGGGFRFLWGISVILLAIPGVWGMVRNLMAPSGY